jgi:hypothetical protein
MWLYYAVSNLWGGLNVMYYYLLYLCTLLFCYSIYVFYLLVRIMEILRLSKRNTSILESYLNLDCIDKLSVSCLHCSPLLQNGFCAFVGNYKNVCKVLSPNNAAKFEALLNIS